LEIALLLPHDAALWKRLRLHIRLADMRTLAAVLVPYHHAPAAAATASSYILLLLLRSLFLVSQCTAGQIALMLWLSMGGAAAAAVLSPGLSCSLQPCVPG
jgi:hypothetical protein